MKKQLAGGGHLLGTQGYKTVVELCISDLHDSLVRTQNRAHVVRRPCSYQINSFK